MIILQSSTRLYPSYENVLLKALSSNNSTHSCMHIMFPEMLIVIMNT